MIKWTFHHEFRFDKSPYVDDGPCLTVDGSDPFAAVPLLQLFQPHINDRVVGIHVVGHRHPRSADILKLKDSCSHHLIQKSGELYN
jgi:hypothetical protein